MTCQPVSSDVQPARIRLTSAQDWLGSVGETFAARLSLAPTPDNVQNRGESMHLEATRVARATSLPHLHDDCRSHGVFTVS
jgi:hypothetical protein